MILSGENLANSGTITMTIDQYIINDGTIGNYGYIYNEGEFDNFGYIYNEGLINNFGYIYNYNEGLIINFLGAIVNHWAIWNDGTIENLSNLYNTNPGIIWNHDTINNLGDFGYLHNNSIVYNMGAITGNPVNNFDGGVVLHNHVHLPLIKSSR